MTTREEIADIFGRMGDLCHRLAVLYRETAPPPRAPAAPPPPAGDDEPPDVQADDERPPADGRQLLGWANRQVPDARPAILNWGARQGIREKVVNWRPDQVRSCYQHVRGTR